MLFLLSFFFKSFIFISWTDFSPSDVKWMAESGQLTDYWNSIRSGTPNNFIAPSPERGTGTVRRSYLQWTGAES